jgi:hypothetical protein
MLIEKVFTTIRRCRTLHTTNCVTLVGYSGNKWPLIVFRRPDIERLHKPYSTYSSDRWLSWTIRWEGTENGREQPVPGCPHTLYPANRQDVDRAIAGSLRQGGPAIGAPDFGIAGCTNYGCSARKPSPRVSPRRHGEHRELREPTRIFHPGIFDESGKTGYPVPCLGGG